MSDSVVALLEIMLDSEASVWTRVEAAGQILAYEAPKEASEAAKELLTEIYENKEHTADLRLAAIKLIRKSEARKITRPPVQPIEDLSGRLERARARLDRIRESDNEDVAQNLPNVDRH
jgi:hypothetical protein